MRWNSALAFFASLSALAAQPQVTFLMGGDVQWSLNLRPASVVLGEADAKDKDWRAIPYSNPENMPARPTKPSHDEIAIRFSLKFTSDEEMLNYPMKRLAPTLRAADFAFFNLETPLSDTARMEGEARTPTGFARALRAAGASVITVGNNHSFDTGVTGFMDTLRALDEASLPHVGGGRDLADGRRPVILEKNGIRIGLLGYAQFSNMNEPEFAAAGRAGITPMDPGLMKEDIRKLKPQVNYVAVSVHWGTDVSANVSPANRSLAHELVDAGADLILGHHTPLPKGIEVYKGKVIVYAPGHVANGHNHPDWPDNYLVRFTLAKKSVSQVEVLPIAGKGQALAQPYLLDGDATLAVLDGVQKRSAALDTQMSVNRNVGVIQVSER